MARSASTTLATIYTKEAAIGAVALAGMAVHLILRFGIGTTGSIFGFPSHEIPLLVALACGIPLVIALVIHLSRLEFSADLLAGISIVTSVMLGEYLAGTLVVLMLSGGQALEA
ncbi:MAG: heavy metal translocating P-type ATPase, partial [Acidobacteriota bacterium]